jgi:8-oxo-dGTP pyrophosphatase MutT (NUDIX family)
MMISYGGVVFDDVGRVLLRRPREEFDGYVWTFAKGRPEPGETPEAAALREVQEETGVQTAIIGQVPGAFRGGTGGNVYFLMRVLSIGSFDPGETAEVAWATPGEAEALIQQTRNVLGRERDLAVLRAAASMRADT